MKSFLTIFLLVTCALVFSDSANILGIFTAPMPSHFILDKALMVNLAKRGHDVTMVTFFEVEDPPKNLKQILYNEDPESLKRMQSVFKNFKGKSMFQVLKDVFNLGPEMITNMLNSTKVQALLKSDEKFDVIVSEVMLGDPSLGFGYHFDCPIVCLSTVGSNQIVNKIFKNPIPTSFIQNMFSFKGKVTFWDRLLNFLAYQFMELFILAINSRQDYLLYEYFPEAPSLQELYKKVAVIFLNSHVSVSPPKPHLPNMIEIGGFHIEEPKPLPKDLQSFMDNSNGTILFSLGSNLQSADLDPTTLKTLLDTFSKLPYQVLWKFEAPDLPNKPSNVRIQKWVPQNDILAHPNLKLFITHGGLLSTTEAVYHGVPIVGMPAFGDQKSNMQMAISNGIGKELNLEELDEKEFLDTILEVIENPRYRKNVRRRSSLMKDQPMKPIDAAIYWTEYVIRHKGADHMKTTAMDLNWIELNQLDVICFVVLVLVVVVYVSCKVFMICIRRICSGSSRKIKTK